MNMIFVVVANLAILYVALINGTVIRVRDLPPDFHGKRRRLRRRRVDIKLWINPELITDVDIELNPAQIGNNQLQISDKQNTCNTQRIL